VKVIAFNSSPHLEKSATNRVLVPFLDGMETAGAEVELSYLHRLEIRPCLGCLACWLKTPGRCAQQDGMAEILPRIAESDTTVYATPLFVDGMNATMKNLLDRSIPLLQPWFVLADNHCRHDRIEGYKNGKVVLVSVCGFTETDNFDPLVGHMKAACRNMRREFAGALLRPYANSLPELAKAGIDVDDVYASAREAGTQLVQTGRMNSGTLDRVSRELIPRNRYIRAVNIHFRQAIRRNLGKA
jgi:multimeric flavodoxin WrbA